MLEWLYLFGIELYTSSIILLFSLWNGVTLCSAFGVACLLAMGVIVDLVKDQLVCSKFNQVFML